MTNDTLYKALKSDGTSPYQDYAWPLPEKNGDGWEPGDWVEAGEGELEECEHGIHACTIHQLPRWLNEDLYELEPAEGDRIDGDDKIVVRRARLVRPVETWTEMTARLFAADCAEMVLPIWEVQHPDDDRPRQAIEAARAYARGDIDDEELRAARRAARSAARSVASSVASSAAWSVARSVASSAAMDVMGDRLALYLERGEEAGEEPVRDIRSLLDEEAGE